MTGVSDEPVTTGAFLTFLPCLAITSFSDSGKPGSHHPPSFAYLNPVYMEVVSDLLACIPIRNNFIN